MNNLRTVFSTDPKDKVLCDKCKNILTDCKCIKQETVGKYTAVLRIEKNGRGGKTVTVIDKLPRNEKYLKDLTKEIKSKCATGGTFRLTQGEAVIEIQGDKMNSVKKILQAKNINFKGG